MAARIDVADRVGVGVQILVERHRIGRIALERVHRREPAQCRVVVACPQVIQTRTIAQLLACESVSICRTAGGLEKIAKRIVVVRVGDVLQLIGQHPGRQIAVVVVIGGVAATMLTDQVQPVDVVGQRHAGGVVLFNDLCERQARVNEEVRYDPVGRRRNAVARKIIGVQGHRAVRRHHLDQAVLEVIAERPCIAGGGLGDHVPVVVKDVGPGPVADQTVVGVICVRDRPAGVRLRETVSDRVVGVADRLVAVDRVGDVFFDEPIEVVVSVFHSSPVLLDDSERLCVCAVRILIGRDDRAI